MPSIVYSTGVRPFYITPRTVIRWRGNRAFVPYEIEWYDLTGVESICDSITASRSKCGFTQLNDDGAPVRRAFKKRTTTIERTTDYIFHNGALEPTHSCTIDIHGDVKTTVIDTVAANDDGTCTTTSGSCSGTAHVSIVPRPPEAPDTLGCGAYGICNNPPAPGGVPATTYDPCSLGTGNVTISGCPLTYANTASYSCSYTTDLPDKKVQTCVGSGGGGAVTSASALDIYTTELEDEDLTEDLLSRVDAAFPAYSGIYGCECCQPDDDNDCSEDPLPICPDVPGQGCECSAYRNLSASEESITKRRFKHKMRFDMAEVDFNITWRERFRPLLTADVVFESTTYHEGDPDPDPTHWTLTDRSDTVTAGDTEAGPYEVLEPATDGITDIIDFGWYRKYKFVFNPPAPAAVSFTMTWDEEFTPTDGSPVTDTPLTAAVAVGDNETAVFETIESTSDGATDVVNVLEI